MSKDDVVVLIQKGAESETITVIVVSAGWARATAVPVPKPRRGWRLSALPVAGVLARALDGSAALALAYWARQVRWGEVLVWLTC